MQDHSPPAPHLPNDRRPAAIFLIFLRLGLTSFGGPVAHIGYFYDEFVARRKWLTPRAYADLVALCQFLPGPASSQVGMALGLLQAGYAGAAAAWCGFTLPSALALMLLASGIYSQGHWLTPGVLHGLAIVAAAVVAQAAWSMARSFCRGGQRLTLMALAAGSALAWPTAWGHIGVIAAAGLAGALRLRPATDATGEPLGWRLPPRSGNLWLMLFFGLLVGLPVTAQLTASQGLQMVDTFYRAGSLVFGGGHVVLPLLQAEVVPAGWLDEATFFAGYGATQAMPGPLFSFAAFVGAAATGSPSGWIGGVICLLAIFAPAFLLVAGVLPAWARLRANAPLQAALSGIQAAVAGVLVATLYHPVGTHAIHSWSDAGWALAALGALTWGKRPAWQLVLAGLLIGWLSV